MQVAGIEYLDEDAELFPNGSVHDATLAHDTRIQGLPCAAGHSVVFFPSGQLQLAWLSHSTVIAGISCAPSIVYLHENGALLNAALAAPYPFADRPIPPGGRITFDEQGSLLEYSIRLDADQLIRGLPASSEFNAWLYPDGSPSVIVRATAADIEGQTYPRGAELFLDAAGTVLEWRQADLDSGKRYQQRVFGVYEAPFE